MWSVLEGSITGVAEFLLNLFLEQVGRSLADISSGMTPILHYSRPLQLPTQCRQSSSTDNRREVQLCEHHMQLVGDTLPQMVVHGLKLCPQHWPGAGTHGAEVQTFT